MSESGQPQYVVIRDPDIDQINAGAARASRTTSTTLYISDIHDDNKLLEEIVVKFGVESVSNPTQRALRWDEITKTFNSLSLTLSGKTMTKDQVRRKWNNMKKLARKKWESYDPSETPKQPENLENSATLEILRQEEDINGSTITTIIVLDQTEKHKSKLPSLPLPPPVAPIKIEANENKVGGRLHARGESEEEEDEGDDGEKANLKRRRKRRPLEEDPEFRDAVEKFGQQEETQAKKRLRWEKRMRNSDTAFLKKKNEIEKKIEEYQSEINQVRKLNNSYSERILEKKIDIQLIEEEIEKVDQILARAQEQFI